MAIFLSPSFSCLLWLPWPYPTWIWTECRSSSLGAEQRSHLAHPAHHSLACFLPIWFSTKARHRKRLPAFRLICLRSHYQILFVKTSAFLTHWCVHLHWTNRLFGRLRSVSSCMTGLFHHNSIWFLFFTSESRVQSCLPRFENSVWICHDFISHFPDQPPCHFDFLSTLSHFSLVFFS